MKRRITRYVTITQLARHYGYSWPWIRRKLAECGAEVIKDDRRSWVSPADQKKLARILKPKAEATLSVA